MLEPLYTADEMRAAEAGHDVSELMERAGRGLARLVLEHFPEARSYTVVCGSGANGGDGRIAASHLQEAGRDVLVVDAKDGTSELGSPDVLVDALFGTGFRGPSRPAAGSLIERMNTLGAPLVAVDIPSGVDASTGEVSGPAVRAHLTVTFHCEKVGLLVSPGRFHTGLVAVADIGLPPVPVRHARATPGILGLVPLRAAADNKYTAGHVLVVGGSAGLTGAPSLAAMAALRADAGYVTLAVPRSTLPAFEARLLEPVKRPLPDDGEGMLTADAFGPVTELAERAGAVALGPGLGRSDATRALVARLLGELELPTVVDADALWGLEPADWPAPRVLTPHAGELGRLLGEESAWVDSHRLRAVELAVERFGCVVVLKGDGTLVGSPGDGVVVCPGSPTLATAGTGDVLTGVIGAFLAKRLQPRLAAVAGVTAQAEAADAAPQKAGLVASDLLDALPRVFP